MKLLSRFLPIIILGLLPLSSSANSGSDLMRSGRYAEAASVYARIADGRPTDAVANVHAAEAYLWAKDVKKAEKYASRTGVHGAYLDALRKLLAYDVDGSAEYLETYRKVKGADAALADGLEARMEKTRSQLERVEKIVVVDSLQVPARDFFKFYRLSDSSGSLVGASELPEGFRADSGTAVFMTQLGDRMMWGAPLEGGKVGIVESSRLADGSWEEPVALDGGVNQGGAKKVSYPYVLQDGVTMYFAMDDPEAGFGGYDIYITRFDGDKFLEPQNLGMPYNSAYNDYMLVIDENSGAGWWATDRNAPAGKVNIYVFRPNDLRVNYSVDEPKLRHLALLDNISLTWPKGFDREGFLAGIPTGKGGTDKISNGGIAIALPDGRVLTDISGIEDDNLADAVAAYRDCMDAMKQLEDRLTGLRAEYAEGNKNVSGEILRMEEKQEQLYREARRLKNLAVGAAMK